MTDDVPYEEKQARLKALVRLQEEIATELNLKYQDQTVKILVEGRKRGNWFGRNRNDKLVFFENDIDLSGELLNVKVTQTSPWSLQGTLTP